MGQKDKYLGEAPTTQWLRAHGVVYTEHHYDFAAGCAGTGRAAPGMSRCCAGCAARVMNSAG
jgi:hypothetical protein